MKSEKSMKTPIFTKKYQVKRLKNSATDLTNIKRRSRSIFRTSEVPITIKEVTKKAKTRPRSVSNKKLSEVK